MTTKTAEPDLDDLDETDDTSPQPTEHDTPEFTPQPYEFLGLDADGLATYHVSWSL